MPLFSYAAATPCRFDSCRLRRLHDAYAAMLMMPLLPLLLSLIYYAIAYIAMPLLPRYAAAIDERKGSML